MQYERVESDRKELRAFLRARRQHLHPEDLGFLPRSRRRASGVTRDEVAEVADVSIGWYAQFELGRPINISAKSLSGIARALRLDRYETQYLYLLSGVAAPSQNDEKLNEVPREAIYVVQSFTSGPAHVWSRRYDLLVQNEAGRLLLNHQADDTKHRYNAVFRMFTDPSRRRLYTNWQDVAGTMTAGLRHNYARAIGDPWFEDLIERLHAASPQFTQMWNEYHVAPLSRPRVRVNLGAFGNGEFTWLFLPIPETNGLQITVWCPDDESSARNLLAYLEAVKKSSPGRAT